MITGDDEEGRGRKELANTAWGGRWRPMLPHLSAGKTSLDLSAGKTSLVQQAWQRLAERRWLQRNVEALEALVQHTIQHGKHWCSIQYEQPCKDSLRWGRQHSMGHGRFARHGKHGKHWCSTQYSMGSTGAAYNASSHVRTPCDGVANTAWGMGGLLGMGSMGSTGAAHNTAWEALVQHTMRATM